MTSYTTLMAAMAAEKTPDKAWDVFVTALQADIAEASAELALENAVSDLATLSANLSANSHAVLLSLFSGGSSAPAGLGGQKAW